MNRYVILGTAGHIDHGKSSLVKVLTGTDPDRLKEEKERGITIDLGFADLAYPDGLRIGIVDVPGHERLIKNMLAGAGGIDIVLMVIAADEGIMPQSREHLDICNLLKVKRGIIAITKSDLVEPEWLDLVTEEARTFAQNSFLRDAAIIPVSAKSGKNIDRLKDELHTVALNAKTKPVEGLFRLPIDRIFTLRGFGTVVTGTAISGKISIDDPVEILPQKRKSRIRGLQSHGESLKTAYAGQRVAVNLQGIAREDVQRGEVITTPNTMTTTTILDAELEALRDANISVLKNRSLVHFHTGTTELVGRIVMYDKEEVKPGEHAFCQFRFQSPLTVMAGDRFIIRRFSPLLTIGGGEILDTSPRRVRRKERGKELARLKEAPLPEKLSMKILQSGFKGMREPELAGWIRAEVPEIRKALDLLVKEGEIIGSEDRFIHKEVFDQLSQTVTQTLGTFHKTNPLKRGMSKEELRAVFRGMEQRLFESLLGRVSGVVTEKETTRLKSFQIALSEDRVALKEKISRALEDAAFQPPTKEELARMVSAKKEEIGELLKIMASEHSLVRINDSLYITDTSYATMMDRLKTFFSSKKEMTVGEFRDILGTSRKYALPFLEYLDSNRITLRVGEVRKYLHK